MQDKDVHVLLATDAAGEGINLQRAHLMVNYDLPWNPNRLEQRFGRIHRIGQTEVCHLWNLLADETREGDVYRRCSKSWNRRGRRSAAGLRYPGPAHSRAGLATCSSKRSAMVTSPKFTAHHVVENASTRPQLQELLEERALANDSMDATRAKNPGRHGTRRRAASAASLH